MKTLKTIVLLSPGKDDSQSGPDASWIENLATNLNLAISKYTGKELLHFTAGNKEAAKQVNESVFLILLMHESYSSSTEYMGLLKNVTGDTKPGKIVRIDTSAQIAADLPGAIENAPGVELFDKQDEPSAAGWMGDDTPAYWSRLLDLAAEVKDTEQQPEEESGKTLGDMVYLAQAAADMGRNRNIIKRELTEYGFRVAPASDLRIYKSDLKSQVQSQADRSRLIIHLLGNSYGESVKELGYSLAELQVQYLTEYLAAIENDPVHAEKEIDRLVWIDPDFSPVDSQQEEFINQLKRNIENLHRTEIIQTPLEMFKSLVIKRLEKELGDPSTGGPDIGSGSFTYIIHSADDQKEAMVLSEGLEKGGVKTGMLDYGKGQVRLLADHKKYLQACEGAVIYYGSHNRHWLRSKLMDLLKAPGLGRVSMLKTRQIVAGKKDSLEDYPLPAEITITREADASKAVSGLLKTLKH